MLKDKIFDDMKGKILRGELTPGERLAERDLCDTYHVSRTPMREVLQHLVYDRLLDRTPSRGYSVRPLEMKDAIEMYQAREAIECMLIRLACLRIDKQAEAELAQIRCELEEADLEKDPLVEVPIGRRLHKLISERSKNALLIEQYQRVMDAFDLISVVIRAITQRSGSMLMQSRDDHLAIIASLLSGDELRCDETMRNHIRGMCKIFIESHFADLKTTWNYVYE